MLKSQHSAWHLESAQKIKHSSREVNILNGSFSPKLHIVDTQGPGSKVLALDKGNWCDVGPAHTGLPCAVHSSSK